MRELPDDSIDLVVTSPPYNLGIAYDTYRDRRSDEDYLQWCHDWAREIRRLLKPEGSFFLNVGASPKQPFLPHELVLRLRDLFALQNTFHWIKSVSVEQDGETRSVGHFKPINSKRFVNDCHEYLFHLTRGGDVTLDRLAIGVPYADKSNVARWRHTDGRDRRCRGNTWFIPYETIKSREKDRPHPATFPTRLAEYCIRIVGRPPAELTMLDPFLGIGHSALAAAKCGVGRFLGFEIDPGYLSTARELLAGHLEREEDGGSVV